MPHIEIFIEEPSMEEALNGLLPKILPSQVSWQYHNFFSKDSLLKELPNRLRGYRSWLPENYRIAVLIDEDRQNCKALKKKLEASAEAAGLVSKTAAEDGQRFVVLNRIVIEELEAWLLGDPRAMRTAYPKLGNYENEAKYRNPDAIKGGTWEATEKLLNQKGYHLGGLQKTKLAKEVTPHMAIERNLSKSFQQFVEGIRLLAEGQQ